MTTYTATYSPDDNKLRLTASARLDAETYARVKAAGFAWAPKQEQFIAPMWTPARADLCIELAGQIDDDDGSLIERAEDRAERFECYRDKRAAESGRALDHVHQITSGIPMGQPILIGHHSQKHAERDAKRIEDGMRKAVQLFDTAEYWKRRAAAAIAHAKYKERADVRHRRIKGIEADQRKAQKASDESAVFLKLWREVLDADASSIKRKDGEAGTAHARALYIANRDHVSACFTLEKYPREAPASIYEGMMSLWSALDGGVCTAEQARDIAIRVHERGQAHRARWLEHYANRLTYERAMLAEAGGIVAERFDLQPGGTITHRGRRSVILRVNRRDGATLSVSVTGQGWTVGVEEITSYEPPSEAAAQAVAAVTAKAPLVNYESEGCARMTQAEWSGIYADTKGTVTVAATDTHAAHRRRFVPGYVGTRYGAPRGEQWGRTFVFITDAKATEAPLLNPPPKAPRKTIARKIAEAAGIDTACQAEPAAPAAPAVCPVTAAKIEARAVLAELTAQAPCATHSAPVPPAGDSHAAKVEALRATLKGGGVQVVSAPQLFPTPPELAARMVEVAGITRGAYVLEPSAGTGRLIDAIAAAVPLDSIHLDCIEVNSGMARALLKKYPAVYAVRPFDFLTFEPSPAHLADRILMNPPFANGADVDHVTHAVQFLKPGGRLVAIMSAGVTFRDDRKTREFREMIEDGGGTIEALPAGTFESSGTGVNVVLVTFDAPSCDDASTPARASIERQSALI